MGVLEEQRRLEEEREKPLERGQAQEGLVVVMLTLDQLEAYGPLALREWLKRTLRAPLCTGEVVAWRGHEATRREE